MKKINLFFCLVLLAVFCISANGQKVESGTVLLKGKITKIKGLVEVLHQGEKVWVLQKKLGANLMEGDSIRTGDRSQASIEISGREPAKLVLRKKSKITLAELYQRKNKSEVKTVKLDFGEVLSRVKKLKTTDSQYKVRTPTATAAVRGTIYLVNYNQKTMVTSVKVFEGIIALENRVGQLMQVDENFKGEVLNNGQTIETQKLTSEDISDSQDLLDSMGVSLPGSGPRGDGFGEDRMDEIEKDIMERIDEIDETIIETLERRRDARNNDDDDDHF